MAVTKRKSFKKSVKKDVHTRKHRRNMKGGVIGENNNLNENSDVKKSASSSIKVKPSGHRKLGARKIIKFSRSNKTPNPNNSESQNTTNSIPSISVTAKHSARILGDQSLFNPLNMYLNKLKSTNKIEVTVLNKMSNDDKQKFRQKFIGDVLSFYQNRFKFENMEDIYKNNDPFKNFMMSKPNPKDQFTNFTRDIENILNVAQAYNEGVDYIDEHNNIILKSTFRKLRN